MVSSLARVGWCVLLPSIAGCLVDRTALVPGDVPDPADARSADEDARTADQDARTADQDARTADQDARTADQDAPATDVDAGSVSPVCGDGTLEAGEECDDAGLSDGDGCDASCRLETSRRVGRGPGLALAIPDDAYDGSLSSMTCVELDVRPFPLDTLTGLEVELAMQHPWVADLVMKLVGPGGAPVVTLVSRPGIAETADDGTRGRGNDADLDPAHPIHFVAGAAVAAEDMGDGIGDTTVCATDPICAFAPDAGAAAPGDLSLFVGGRASGAWRVCVGDAAGNDVGEIDAVSLLMELAR